MFSQAKRVPFKDLRQNLLVGLTRDIIEKSIIFWYTSDLFKALRVRRVL